MKEVKICGLRTIEDIKAINELKPDYCGFIINFPKSKRNISVETLRTLTAALCSDVTPVGVFVDQPPEFIAELLNDGTIKIAQLHGNEDNDYIEDLMDLTDGQIWQAFQVHSKEDVENAAESMADLVILDAGQGTGKAFNWELISGFPGPFALAGGLNTENANEALKTDAVLLDVSGGVETDGKKDYEKIKKFIEAVRA